MLHITRTHVIICALFVVLFLLVGLSLGWATASGWPDSTITAALVASILALTASILGPSLTFHYAALQFQFQQRWQKKCEVYAGILTTLASLEDDLCILTQVPYGSDGSIEAEPRCERARAEFLPLAAVARYVVSPEAVLVVDQLENELDLTEFPAALALVRNCQKRLTKLAKADLGT